MQPASAVMLALFGGAEASSWGSNLEAWASYDSPSYSTPSYTAATPSYTAAATPSYSFASTPSTATGISSFEGYAPSASFGATDWGVPASTTSYVAPAMSSTYAFPSSTANSWDSWATDTTSDWSTASAAAAPSLLTSSYTPIAQSYASTLASSSAYEFAPSQAMYAAAEVEFKAPKGNGKKADDVFDQTSVRRYNIEISQSDIRKLNADISAEEYVPCSITTDYGDADATTYTGTGCRYKGAVGSLLKCLEPSTGRPNGDCRKLSIKVDGNKYRDDDQKIDGVKHLLLHGMAVDESLVSERLAYTAMNDVGISSPRATHAQLYINGKFDGVYTTVEAPGNTVSKRFFKDDANKGKGAWYKDLWFQADQMSTSALEEMLKSGDEEHAFMKEAYNMIQTSSDCASFERYFDVDAIAKITAFNDYIGQTDDWRYRHNFQWYVHEDIYGTKKLVMIPWDYDRLDDKSGGLPVRRQRVNSWMNSKPSGSQCYQSDPPVQSQGYGAFSRTYKQRIEAGMPPGLSKPIECDKITRFISKCGYDKVKQYEASYAAQMPYSTLSARVDQYANEIASSVDQDKSISSSEWQQGRSSLKSFLRTAPQYSPTKGSAASMGMGSSTSGFGGMGGSQFGSQFGSSQFGGQFGSSLGGSQFGSSLGGFGSSLGGFGGSQFGSSLGGFGSSLGGFGGGSSFGGSSMWGR